MMQIFNIQYESVKGSSSNNYVRTPLVNNQRLLPSNDFSTTIDEVETYNNERENCDKYRLIVTINPLCSNVLFNRISEVIVDEGSDECKCLNFTNIDSVLNSTSYKPYGKAMNAFNTKPQYGSISLTRDTQLSRYDGITYKCGLDIFNNHILRSKTFKCVCGTQSDTNEFNTILDNMREWHGKQVEGYATNSNSKIPLHLYLAEDILPYDESVDANLSEENGWLGFTNVSKILSRDPKKETDNTLSLNKVINNAASCGFIDMCPERDLWYFTPKFNSKRNRFEKNWNYCLTYPSSSTSSNISFIREKTNSLKIYYFDDKVKIGGLTMCKIVSFCKHGLIVDDIINLYFNGNDNSQEDTVISNLRVLKVEDEYTFYVKYSEQDWISTSNFIYWTTLSNFSSALENNGINATRYTWTTSDRRFVYKSDNVNEKYAVFTKNGKYCVNLDANSTDVSFKQVINSEEVQYYVRIFSKLPNWKLAEKRLNDFMSENDRQTLIREYSSKKYEFDSSISQLAFAKNAYGDDISQIVFTDDISLGGLTDNLGRPLTDIYLTIIKNNAGYREWYGKNGIASTPNDSKVEFSHVFGKNSCAFELCPKTVGNLDHQNIIQNNNVDKSWNMQGLDVSYINQIQGGRPSSLDNDEIEVNIVGDYQGDVSFYGDLCLYSPSAIAEVVIDDIWFRFNTAQRELNSKDSVYSKINCLAYDEILSDDYDATGFKSTVESVPNAVIGKEGYRYKPHYRIPIRTFSQQLQEAMPHIVGVKKIELDKEDKQVYIVTTAEESYVEPNTEFIIHNKQRNLYYTCTSVKENVLTTTKFKFKVNDTSEEPFFSDSFEVYSLIKKQETIPSHAIFLKDGSYKYVWRDLYANGFDNYSPNEVYPFTNGAMYIEKNIRFFCRRQDADKLMAYASTSTSVSIQDVEPKKPNSLEEDNYKNEEEMSCF